MGKNICIFGLANGVGISRDISIIKDVLIHNGFEVDIQNPFKPHLKKHYDMSIFLERFSDGVLEASPINIFIPNPEWFEPGWLPALNSFSCVFTKTHMATDVFKNLGCVTEYIGFTSEDRFLPNVNKDYMHWFHLAGKSIQKQTEIVWKTWQKNPGFPQLTILQDPKFFKSRPVLRNVNYMYDRMPEYLLKVMQNTFGVHVCPSITEGFGHYIMEAMSCQSIVITTNAVPMTEFITKESGVLVDIIKQEKMRLSISNIISVETLEKAVIQAMVMDDMSRINIGRRVREFFLNNDVEFKKRFIHAVKKCLD